MPRGTFSRLARKMCMDPERWLTFCAKRTTPQLFEGLRRLHAREGRSLVAILAHLGELDDRMAVLEKAFPSLFRYCTMELGYSEAEALLRIRTARAARRFPSILTMIEKRQIHVTAVAKLYPYLDSKNYRGLLAKASRRSLEELDRLIAEIAPLPEKRPVIRVLSAGGGVPGGAGPAAPTGDDHLGRGLFEAAPGPPPVVEAGSPSGEGGGAGHGAGGVPPAAPAPRAADAVPAGRQDGRVLFHFVAGEDLLAKFKRAKGLLWHKYPAGLPENIFADALEALLDRKDPDRRIERKRRRAAAREAARAQAGSRPSPAQACASLPLSQGSQAIM